MDIQDICTFVIPFRIDGEERQRNLEFVVNWLSPLRSRILLLEADAYPHINKQKFHGNVEYSFLEDGNDVFHRTHYINRLLRQCKTDIVAVWDADVVTSYSQIEEAVMNILQGCTMAYPYNGEFVMLTEECTKFFIEAHDLRKLEVMGLSPVFNRPFCGGAFFVNREKYLTIGGENERFTGWGPEDAERLRRCQIMGHNVKWTKSGKAYHLYHPRKKNSRFCDDKAAILLRQELVKVCCMDKEELTEYIKNDMKYQKDITCSSSSSEIR